MPFKSGKTFDNVNAKIKDFAGRVLPTRIERALYILGGELGALADHYVPVDTATLRNSRRQSVSQQGENITLTIGYYANYAAALHNPNKGSKMDGWKPRPVPSPGKPTGGYNAQARQGWLNIAWDEDGMRLLSDFIGDITK